MSTNKTPRQPGRRSLATGLLIGLLLASTASASGPEAGTMGFGVANAEGELHLEAGLFHTEEEAAHRAEALGAGFHAMPLTYYAEHGQSSLFKFEPGTSLWLLITFSILFGGLYRFAWPKILSGLQERERSIYEAVKSAERTNAEAAALLAQYEARLAKARDEVQTIIDEGKRDAAKVKEDIVQQGWKDAEEIKTRVKREMQMAEASVLKDIYSKMAALSTEIASRIIERELNPSEHVRLVNDAIAKYRQS